MSIKIPNSEFNILLQEQREKQQLEREQEAWERMSPARFEFWAKREQWAVRELAYLLKGKEPKDKDRHSQAWGLLPKTFQQHYEDLQAFARDIIHRIPPVSIHGELTYNPSKLLIWVKSKGFDIPEELVHLLGGGEPERQKTEKEKLDPRERTTLLQIIAVLAAEAKLDLTRHSKAAEIMQKMGAGHSLELPVKKDTIATKLKEARDLQKTR